MIKRTIAIIGIIAVYSLTAICQQDASEIIWSQTNRLTSEDFKMEYNGNSNMPCFAQFSMNYSVNGFDFLAKNFNQKVKNVMYSNASWLDKSSDDVDRMIMYQQILFDIAEVYTRKFRKDLFINRKKIAKGVQIADDLNNQIVKEMTEVRAQFEMESDNGQNVIVLDNWKNRIELELQELSQFSFDNSSRIRL